MYKKLRLSLFSFCLGFAMLQGQILYPAAAVRSGLCLPNGRSKADTNSMSATLFRSLATTDPVIKRFGVPQALVATQGNANGIVGIAINNLAPGTWGFPTGVTGYGKLAGGSAGNQVFGLVGQVDQYDRGVATNELDSDNWAGAPSGKLPPDRSIGTREILPVTLTLGAQGNYPSAIALQIGRGGDHPQPSLTGVYMNPDAVTQYGVVVDASPRGGPKVSELLKNTGRGINLRLVTSGPEIAGNPVLEVSDSLHRMHAAIMQNGDISGNNLKLTGSFSASPSVPASNTAPCTMGQIEWGTSSDRSYIYVCVANNMWRRAALQAF